MGRGLIKSGASCHIMAVGVIRVKEAIFNCFTDFDLCCICTCTLVYTLYVQIAAICLQLGLAVTQTCAIRTASANSVVYIEGLL